MDMPHNLMYTKEQHLRRDFACKDVLLAPQQRMLQSLGVMKQ